MPELYVLLVFFIFKEDRNKYDINDTFSLVNKEDFFFTIYTFYSLTQ